jgi:hypothetical protein
MSYHQLACHTIEKEHAVAGERNLVTLGDSAAAH